MAYRVLICSCWLVAVLIIMLSLFRRNEMNVGSTSLPCCYFLEAIYKETTYLVREDPRWQLGQCVPLFEPLQNAWILCLGHY